MPRHSNETLSDTHLDAKEVVGGFLWGRFPGRWRDGTRDATVSARLSPSSDGLYDSRKYHFWCGSPMWWVLTTSFHCRLNSQKRDNSRNSFSWPHENLLKRTLSLWMQHLHRLKYRRNALQRCERAHSIYTMIVYIPNYTYTQHTRVYMIYRRWIE